MERLPSGEQYRIAHGDQQATIVEVGGGVREYSQAGRPILDPYNAASMCDGAHGTPLIPWPNRLAGGRYRFDGHDYQVALTEPAKDNAIHGFLRWQSWKAIRHDADRVVMAATVFPQTGYPFLLDVAVDYRLTGEGLVVTTTATNAGDRACPYGCGQHPYLSPGSGLLDDCDLEFAAETRITTDEPRQLPVGTESIGGTPFDFRTRRRIGSLHIDFAFTDLARDSEGRAWVRLWGTDGHCAELWVDARGAPQGAGLTARGAPQGAGLRKPYPFVEIYTGDTLAPERRRRGLGTEPMSCPPNALQSGEGVIRLQPGASVTTRWGSRLGA